MFVKEEIFDVIDGDFNLLDYINHEALEKEFNEFLGISEYEPTFLKLVPHPTFKDIMRLQYKLPKYRLLLIDMTITNKFIDCHIRNIYSNHNKLDKVVTNYFTHEAIKVREKRETLKKLRDKL